MEGESIKEVQELLGHSEVKMTMKYAHLSPGFHHDSLATLDDPEIPDQGDENCELAAEKVEQNWNISNVIPLTMRN